jgi:hypothetical protein
MRVVIWHCYHYGKHETSIIVAETNDLLRSKVRGVITSEWRDEDDGPMPEDFSELMDAYNEQHSDQYFGDWDWSVIDVSLCEKEAAQ